MGRHLSRTFRTSVTQSPDSTRQAPPPAPNSLPRGVGSGSRRRTGEAVTETDRPRGAGPGTAVSSCSAPQAHERPEVGPLSLLYWRHPWGRALGSSRCFLKTLLLPPTTVLTAEVAEPADRPREGLSKARGVVLFAQGLGREEGRGGTWVGRGYPCVAGGTGGRGQEDPRGPGAPRVAGRGPRERPRSSPEPRVLRRDGKRAQGRPPNSRQGPALAWAPLSKPRGPRERACVCGGARLAERGMPSGPGARGSYLGLPRQHSACERARAAASFSARGAARALPGAHGSGTAGDGGNAVSGLRGAGLLPPGSGLRGAARRGRRAPWRTWSVKRCPVKRKETVRNTADAGSPPPQRGLPLQKPGLSREPLAAGVLQGGNYCTDGSVLESQAGNLPQATTGGGRSRSVGCLQRGGRRSSGRRVTVLHR